MPKLKKPNASAEESSYKSINSKVNEKAEKAILSIIRFIDSKYKSQNTVILNIYIIKYNQSLISFEIEFFLDNADEVINQIIELILDMVNWCE